jgi:DNA-nicking Smr family endonuclease
MKNPLGATIPTDAELFQQALEGVTPIAPPNQIPPGISSKKQPGYRAALVAPVIVDSFSDHAATNVDFPEGSANSYRRNGLNQMTLRKLRRGYWPIQDSIDLHGYTSEEARKFLAEFLHHALERGHRCVNVIHGKGLRAVGGEGILKVRVRHWLTQVPRVLAYCEAPGNAGGSGAVWVLLQP